MNMRVGMAIVVAVLLAAWVWVTETVGMAWFVGLIGWALYVAAGGKMKGLGRVIAAGVLGMIFIAVIYFVSILAHFDSMAWLAIAIAALGVVLCAKIPLFSYLPAGLCGIAVLGAGGPMGLMDIPGNTKLGLSFVVGAIVGFVADWVSARISKQAAGA